MNVKRADIRLVAGLVMLPAVLLQTSVLFQFVQVCYAVGLAVYFKRRFRLLPNVLLLITVTLVNVFQPNGLHLFDIGSLSVTAGALLVGIRKAFTLIGLLYLSQYMVSAKPKFPGALGRLLSMQFIYVDKIAERWASMDKRKPIQAIDTLLLSFESENIFIENHEESVDTSQKILIELRYNIIHCALFWILFILGSSALADTLTVYLY